MAKVYTMEELKRARKKAQIREWFQDKKVKAQTWCYEHKEQIITYGPVSEGFVLLRQKFGTLLEIASGTDERRMAGNR